MCDIISSVLDYSSSSVLNKDNQIETIDIIYLPLMRQCSEYLQLNAD